MKKRILCFGDSNTYGYAPDGSRFDEETRWPMRLGIELGAEYTVIEEGFCGRTCVYDDPVEGGYKSGLNYLPPCIMSHNPLDVVLLMLGTNDTKKRFGLNAENIGEAMMQLVVAAQRYAFNAEGKPSKIVVVSPAPIRDNLMQRRFAECFGEQAIAVSKAVPREFRKISKLARCGYFEAGRYAEASLEDAVHMTAESHASLAKALADKVRSML